MGFPANTPALWSFIGLVGGIVAIAASFAWLYFCYFPGGYKKAEVMDMGDYAMFVAQMKIEERKKKLEQAEEEEYEDDYDELYHEHDNGGYADEEEEAFAREFQSEGTSEGRDIEGGEFYDGTSSSSPSTQTYSQAGQTYEVSPCALLPVLTCRRELLAHAALCH